MAQDPEQQKIDEAPDPHYPYGATPQATPLSYISPEFYAAQPDVPVYTPVESSGYTMPTPDPYQAPPIPMPYGVQSNYGHGGYAQGYTAPPFFMPQQPQATPLPLGEAIRQLPAQYWRVITRPSSTTFAAEMGKARWNIVWVQIAFYIVLVTIIGVLSNVLVVSSRTNSLSSTNGTTLTPATAAAIQRLLSFISILSTYGQILLIPLSLFVGTGLLFLLAKAFGGNGKFLSQLYSSLLFLVPLSVLLNVLTLLLSLLPGAGSLLSFLAIFAYLSYEGTLLGMMLVPVHRLSSGRAAGAVLSLYGVAILLSCVLGFVVALILTASLGPR
jgi:hypothetical protein